MKNTILLLLSFYLLTVAFSKVTGQSLSFEKSFSTVESIDMDLIVGDLKIRPSDSDEVMLKAYFDDELLQVEANMRSGKLKVKEKTVKRKNNNLESKYELFIPDEMELEVNLATGSVDIENFSGHFKGNSGTGSFDLVNAEGEITLNSGTGSVRIENGKGELDLNSGTGSVRVYSVEGMVKCNSGTGKVEIQKSKGGFTGSSGTGKVIVAGTTITADSKFNSVTGSVKVELAAATTADIEVSSGTGNATLNFAGADFAGTLTMVCGKRKGNIQAPFSFDEEWTEGQGNNQKLYKSKRFGQSDASIRISTGTGKAVAIK